MDFQSLCDLFGKPKEKKIPVIIKVIIVCVLLSIVLIAIIFYSTNLNKEEQSQNNNERTNSNVLTTPVYDHDKLVSDYQNSLKKYLTEFDGNYETLEAKITNMNNVPSDYQKLHFELVLALDRIVYENNKSVALEKLNTVSKENEWIKDDLQKLINSLK